MIGDGPNARHFKSNSDNLHESTGLLGPNEENITGLKVERRPLAMAWISDDLLAQTIELWSESYGRTVSEDEAVEILMIVKCLTEFMLELRNETPPPISSE